MDPTMVFATGYVAGGAVGKLVGTTASSWLGIQGAVKYNWGAGRFYGAGGRFVGTSAGAVAFSAAKASDATAATLVEQFINVNNTGVQSSQPPSVIWW